MVLIKENKEDNHYVIPLAVGVGIIGTLLIDRALAQPNIPVECYVQEPSQMFEYINHYGNTDAYMITEVSGNNTATTQSPHKMLLSTSSSAGYSTYRTNDSFILSSTPMVVNFIVTDINGGSSGFPRFDVGFMTNWGNIYSQNGAHFQWNVGSPYWICLTRYTSFNETKTVLTSNPINNGDMLTIIANNTEVKYYINNTLVATHTTTLPTGSMNIGCNLISGGTSVPATISIDMIDIKI